MRESNIGKSRSVRLAAVLAASVMTAIIVAGTANKGYAATAPAADAGTVGASTETTAETAAANGTTSDDGGATATTSDNNATAATLPTIYAVKSVAGNVEIRSDEAVDISTVSEYLETNLTATVDAATGTELTTEDWQGAIATVAWDANPVGYDATNEDEYSFTWSGVIKTGSAVYADASRTKAATVAADIPVTVTYDVVKGGSVSASRAPQTGDALTPGIWIYLLIVGVVISLCSLILFRDKSA